MVKSYVDEFDIGELVAYFNSDDEVAVTVREQLLQPELELEKDAALDKKLVDNAVETMAGAPHNTRRLQFAHALAGVCVVICCR